MFGSLHITLMSVRNTGFFQFWRSSLKISHVKLANIGFDKLAISVTACES